MAERCPECYAELPEDAVWVCPSCAYTLRTPAVAKVGIAIMLLGVVLLGSYLVGPETLGLRSGWMPSELAEFTIANYAWLVLGVLGLGMALVILGAVKVRVERAAMAA